MMPEEGSHKTDDLQIAERSSENAVDAQKTSSFTDDEIPKLAIEAAEIMKRISPVAATDAIDAHAAAVEEKILDTTETLEYANDLLGTLTQFLSKLNHLSSLAKTVRTSSWIASMAIAGLSFITTPVIYLAAFILGGKPKITGKQVSNLAYSGLIFGTALVSFLVPGAFAILGLVAAIGVTGIAVYAMAKTYHNYTLLREKCFDKQGEIVALNTKVDSLMVQAKAIQNDILLKCQISPSTIALYQETLKQRDNLRACAKEIHHTREQLDALKENQREFDKEIKNLHIEDVFTRGVEVALAAIGLVGAVAMFIFPPVGLGILAGAAALGGVYILGRITYPWIKRAIDWFKGKTRGADSVVEQNDQSKSHQQVPDSTAKIQEELSHGANASKTANKKDDLVSAAAKTQQFAEPLQTTAPSLSSDPLQAVSVVEESLSLEDELRPK